MLRFNSVLKTTLLSVSYTSRKRGPLLLPTPSIRTIPFPRVAAFVINAELSVLKPNFVQVGGENGPGRENRKDHKDD